MQDIDLPMIEKVNDFKCTVSLQWLVIAVGRHLDLVIYKFKLPDFEQVGEPITLGETLALAPETSKFC
jgi:hypothetical protein